MSSGHYEGWARRIKGKYARTATDVVCVGELQFAPTAVEIHNAKGKNC